MENSQKYRYRMSPPKLILGLTVVCCSLLGAIAGAKAEVTEEEKRQLRTGFFEEERRVRFGFEDFVDVALDGVNPLGGNGPNNPAPGIPADALTNTGFGPTGGTISIGINSDKPNFLDGSFVGPGVNLQFRNVRQGSVPQRGTLELAPGSFINGRPIRGLRNYRGGGNEKGDTFTGRVQLIDPNNPTDTIYIQVPPTRDQDPRSDFGRGPGSLSTGRFLDR